MTILCHSAALTDIADNVSNKILWGKQSKALERSIRTAET
jgi:hypothetical protein